MADTLTAVYKFVLPEVGASDETWGTKLNTDWSKVEALLLSGFAGGTDTDIGKLKATHFPSTLVTDFELSNNSPTINFTEADQADPVGRYRITARGGDFLFQMSTGLAWASADNLWRYSQSADRLINSKPIQLIADSWVGGIFDTSATDIRSTKLSNGAVSLQKANPDAGDTIVFEIFKGTARTAKITLDGTFTGIGSGLGSLNASALSSGKVPDARMYKANFLGGVDDFNNPTFGWVDTADPPARIPGIGMYRSGSTIGFAIAAAAALNISAAKVEVRGTTKFSGDGSLLTSLNGDEVQLALGAAASVTAVGGFAMLVCSSASDSTPGTNRTGVLNYASAGGQTGAAAPGTWTCCGFAKGGGGVEERTTLWRRAS